MKGTLEITTTVPCILMCKYCPQATLIKQYGRKNQSMTIETFKTCVDKVPTDIYIDFSGYAECFLNKRASEMMRYVYFETGHRVRLYTTLKGCSLDDIDLIRDIDFSEIVLHLPDNDNLMKANIDDEYIEVFKKFTVDIGYSKAHSHGPLHDKLKPLIKNCRQNPIEPQHLHTRANNIDPDKVKLNMKKENYRAGKIWCGVIDRGGGDRLNHNVLLPDGSVQLCCMTYGLEHPLGNLLFQDYEDLFTGEEYNKVIRAMNGDESIEIACRTCRESIPK